MKKVYVCHPFKSDQVKNIAKVKKIVLASREIFPDILPIAPHVYLPNFFNEETEREEAMQACLSLVVASKELWAFITPEGTTSGMRRELDKAEKRGIIVREVEYRETENIFVFYPRETLMVIDVMNTNKKLKAMQGDAK